MKHTKSQNCRICKVRISSYKPAGMIKKHQRPSCQIQVFCEVFFQKARNSIKRSIPYALSFRIHRKFWNCWKATITSVSDVNSFKMIKQCHPECEQTKTRRCLHVLIHTHSNSNTYASQRLCSPYIISMLVSTIANWSHSSVKYGFFAKSFFQKARNSIKKSFSIHSVF